MGDNQNDVMRGEVEGSLATLTIQELEGVCTAIDLPADDALKGNKNKLFRHLLSHLWAEGDKEDGGFATYKIVHEHITQLGKVVDENKPVDVKPDLKTVNATALEAKKVQSAPGVSVKESIVSASNEGVKSSKRSGIVEVHQRLQTFKINGVIGGEKDNITFDNLNFQVNNALEAGYNEPSICGAILKAISPSNSLRSLFETEKKLDVDSMLDILRPYLVQSKDSASYYAELCSSKQRPPDKTAMDFVVRLLGLRNRIVKLSAEEGTPFDQNLLRKQFFKTMFSGLQNQNIRAEVRESCKSVSDGEISGSDLMKIVAEAMSNETLRAGNFSASKEVNLMESNSGGGGENECLRLDAQRKVGKNKENLLPAQVDKQKQEINALKAEVTELRGQNTEIKSLLVANNNLLKAQAQAQVNATAANSTGFSFGALAHPAGVTPPALNGKNNIPGGGARKPKNWPKKCPNCHQNNVFRCFHCWDCGANDHKKGDPNCPENQ